jgi:hypothetical protein
MSLSGCIRCDDIVCNCGYDYLTWTRERLFDHIKILMEVYSIITIYGNASDGDMFAAKQDKLYEKLQALQKSGINVVPSFTHIIELCNNQQLLTAEVSKEINTKFWNLLLDIPSSNKNK